MTLAKSLGELWASTVGWLMACSLLSARHVSSMHQAGLRGDVQTARFARDVVGSLRGEVAEERLFLAVCKFDVGTIDFAAVEEATTYHPTVQADRHAE